MRKIIEAAGGILYRRRQRTVDGADVAEVGDMRSDARFAAASNPSNAMATTAGPDGVDRSGETNGTNEENESGIDVDAARDGAQRGVPLFDDIELCLVHRPKYDDWSWPKGKLDPNESHRHAAVREIGEETGMSVALGPYLGEIEYPQSEEGSKLRHTKDRTVDTKHILFWMATAISPVENLKRTGAFGPVHRADKDEIDEIVWLTPDKARKKLSHSTDREILALFIDRLEEGAADAVPFLIVRHGKAEARKAWRGTDANRPITPLGAAAAFALSYELACFNPIRLSTSPWIRCQETIEMFAWQTGRDMVNLPALTEDAFARDPDGAWECMLSEIEYALDHRLPTAVCMHRPVIGGIFEHLRDLCVSPLLAKRLIAKSPYMPTGNAMALFVTPTPDGPRIIDIQKVAPLVY